MRDHRIVLVASAALLACTSMTSSTANASTPAVSAPAMAVESVAAPAAAGAVKSREVRVFADTAMRAKATTDSRMIRVIPANSFVTMGTGPTAGQWLPVVVDGKFGYVKRKHAEGPWSGMRQPGDSRVKPISATQRKKIIELGL